jgi:glycerol-3-phosphate dehydrogenase (NAD(P)+)
LKNAYSLSVSLAVGIAEREAGIDASSAVNEFGADALPCTPDLNPGFNPQAALFGQSCVEMRRLVALLGGNPDLISGPAGAGDLYVTIFGGRTRRLGTLLGRGLPYGEAKEMLAGVTLESVSIIIRMAAALRARAARGEVSLESFPLMMHLDAIINQGASVSPDWDSFGSGETMQIPKA